MIGEKKGKSSFFNFIKNILFWVKGEEFIYWPLEEKRIIKYKKFFGGEIFYFSTSNKKTVKSPVTGKIIKIFPGKGIQIESKKHTQIIIIWEGSKNENKILSIKAELNKKIKEKSTIFELEEKNKGKLLIFFPFDEKNELIEKLENQEENFLKIKKIRKFLNWS